MRQAIEEAFILDVLKHYTTYATYFKLLKACDDDPHVEHGIPPLEDVERVLGDVDE